MAIDFHTHCFPDRIAERAIKVLEENIFEYGQDYNPQGAFLDGTLAALKKSSKAAGLDASLVLPIATSEKPSQSLNNTAIEINGTEGVYSFGSVHPRASNCFEELERLKENGIKGIKLHPEYQSFFVNEPEMIAVAEKAKELDLWIVFHSGKDVGMPPPVHCPPEQILYLCDKVGYDKMVFAHMGGFGLWNEVLEVADNYRNLGIYIDTAVSIDKFEPDSKTGETFAKIIEKVGADHVLFGSDSPWSDQKTAKEKTVEFLKFYRYSEADINKIMGDNAKMVLGCDITT